MFSAKLLIATLAVSQQLPLQMLEFVCHLATQASEFN